MVGICPWHGTILRGDQDFGCMVNHPILAARREVVARGTSSVTYVGEIRWDAVRLKMDLKGGGAGIGFRFWGLRQRRCLDIGGTGKLVLK